MAAVWQLTITPIDVPTKTASITAVRTDGADVWTFRIISAILATPQQKQDALDDIRSQFLKSESVAVAVSDFVGDLEADGKTALELLEVI